MDRLMKEDFIPVNFKEYYTYTLHGTTGGSHSVRCALSAQCIDNAYAVFRNGNYQTQGIKTQTYTGVTLGDTSCSNALFFKSFNNADLVKGNFRYSWSVNNVKYPQYDGDIVGAAFDLTYSPNKIGNEAPGNMITSLQHYQNGMAVIPLCLNMPGQSVSVMSGYDSRGNSTQITFDVKGQTAPVADANAQTQAALSTFVVLETTAQMKISSGRQVSVDL